MRLRLFVFWVVFFGGCCGIFSHAQAEPLSLREVRIVAAVSPSFQALPNWRQDFERRLAYASQIFEREFKIKFRLVRYADWRPKNEKEKIGRVLDELRSELPLRGEVDFVIGLLYYQELPSDPKALANMHEIGQARPFGGHLVIRYPAQKLYRVQEETVLAHELGHAFGAVHVANSKSIMAPVVSKQIPTQFDSLNRQVITQTRMLNFQKGPEALSKKNLESLLHSYLKLARQNDSADFFYSLGRLYLELGQYSDALKAWKQAVNLDPQNFEFLYHLGALYFKTGDLNHSVSVLGRAVAGLDLPGQRAMQASALMMLGEAYYAKDNMYAAYNAWARAAALRPGDLNLKVNLAGVKLKQGQTLEAVANLEQVLQQKPRHLKALVLLGRALIAQEKFSEGAAYLELALTQLQAAPKSRASSASLSSIYGDLGEVYLKMNQTAKAYEHFQAACDLAPSADCHERLGIMLFKNKQWEFAAREFSQVLKFRKDDANIYGLLGTALTQKGDYQNAIGVFREGLKHAREPKIQSRFYRNIGNLFLIHKSYNLAEPEFHLALSKDWSDVENHFGLASAQLGKNETFAAIDTLRDILRLDPKNERAQKMLSAIQASLNSEGGSHG